MKFYHNSKIGIWLAFRVSEAAMNITNTWIAVIHQELILLPKFVQQNHVYIL